MCGVSSHESFTQLFSQRNEFGLFQRFQDFFISCNGSMIFKSIGRAAVHTFVVRVYRATRNRPDRLLGTTEEVGRQGTRHFKNPEELWQSTSNHCSRQKSGLGNKEEMPGGDLSGDTKKNMTLEDL